jgi:hypothetical protein
MSFIDSTKPQNSPFAGALARHLPGVFAATIFLSALLLFGVQPMFTKMVLPALGGSPAVWSVAMVFFQTLLLLGYIYAHLSVRFLTPVQAVAIHAVLIATALMVLPLAVSKAFGAPPDTGQGFWLIAVFTASVGLPFFVLAATAPLLQAWFSRSGHARSANPYFLYVASNLGSFAALLAYPLLVEPLMLLQTQTWTWMLLFAALGTGLIGCGVLAVLGHRSSTAATLDVAFPDGPAAISLSWRSRAAWIGLAAVPSGLLVSVTAHLSTDVASAPLLWVLPLALFMLTFVLAFQDITAKNDQMLQTAFARVLPFLVMSLSSYGLPLALQFVIHLGGLFLAAMVCHRRLYQLRPDASRLTEFYLWMSFGGMLGGLFAGLLAPVLFDTILEYRILLVAALLCLPAAALAPSKNQQLAFAAAGITLAVLFSFAVPYFQFQGVNLVKPVCLAVGAGFLAIILFNRSGPVASAGAAVAAFVVLAPIGGSLPEAVVRSFFGVNYVRLDPGGEMRILAHGSTIHGAHRVYLADGSPMKGRPQPTTYYHDDGGINIALQAARAHAGGQLGNVAVLGLGAGAMACQAMPRENWVFFEIDKEVVTLARRSDLFPFLSACTPDARIVIGDARLTLQKETIKYDVIILDAFSSDAVPAHLLTREAFAVYHKRLNPGGTIIAHVSNRYMDIRTVAEAGGLDMGMAVASALLNVDPNQEKAKLQMAIPTNTVAMSHNAGNLEMLLRSGKWQVPGEGVRSNLWTDDYANLPAAIYRLWREKPAGPQP